MAAMEWNGKVKVAVAELSRGAQLQLWRDIADITSDDQADDVTQVRLINDTITQQATRAVFVCEDGEWRKIANGETIEFEVDDAPYSITLPITSENLDELPFSLAKQWGDAAAEANAHLRQLLFLSEEATKTGTPSTTTSEPPSGSGH